MARCSLNILQHATAAGWGIPAVRQERLAAVPLRDPAFSEARAKLLEQLLCAPRVLASRSCSLTTPKLHRFCCQLARSRERLTAHCARVLIIHKGLMLLLHAQRFKLFPLSLM